jgi:hypothetical protein
LYDRLELAQALIAAGAPDRAVEHLLVAIKLNKADGTAKETLLKVGWSPAPSGVAWHAHAASPQVGEAGLTFKLRPGVCTRAGV